MSLSSMTGFARSEGQNDLYSWTWEIKSVNSKGLDIRCRLPGGFDGLEPIVREQGAAKFRRGNISVNLNLTRVQNAGGLQVNQQVIDDIAAVIPVIEASFGKLQEPNIASILALRGVLEPVDDQLSDDDKKILEAAVLRDLEQGFGALFSMRAGEGARLLNVLDLQLGTIDDLTAEATRLAATQPDAIRGRLKDQLAEVLQSVPALSEERLAQEVALLITKADIREELDRLRSHVQAARELFDVGGAVGRKLDFLCQELNREANTLCSKSSDVELTRIGLDLKAMIEQFREQIQNIE